MLDIIRGIKENARMLAGVLVAVATVLEAVLKLLESACDDH